MNLFDDESRQLLLSLGFLESWAEILSHELDENNLEELLAKIEEERKSKIIYPDREDVFKLFKTIKYDDVKVVVIGQDPYHNGNANGIAFACKQSVSPSLVQIGNAMRMNGYNNPSRNINLDYLTAQGVFLFNTVLTVEAAKPNSHKNIGWLHFTSCVIAALSRKKDLIWLLWGAEAQSIKAFINTNHAILEYEHPAAASYGNREWKCMHFSIVNEWLENKGLTKINW